jgi:hypothetical protein
MIPDRQQCSQTAQSSQVQMETHRLKSVLLITPTIR